MKAVVIYEAGAPENLIYTDVLTPKVKTGWSLVDQRSGRYQSFRGIQGQGQSQVCEVFQIFLVSKGVGLIVGSTGTVRLSIGTKVISAMGEAGRAFDGGYAEYASCPMSRSIL